MKVKRLRTDCCGMKAGAIYIAEIHGSYVHVLLPTGEWTQEHWADWDGDPWFEVVE